MQTHLLMHLQYSSSVRKDRPPIKASIGLPGPVMKMIMAPTPRVTRPGATWGDKGTAAEGWSDLQFFAIFENEHYMLMSPTPKKSANLTVRARRTRGKVFIYKNHRDRM